MLQTMYENAGKWSCLTQDYLYAVIDFLSPTLDDEAKLNMLNTAIMAAYIGKAGIDEEFYVSDPVRLMKKMAAALGKSINVSVTKQDITKFDDIPNDGKYRAVRKSYNGKSHYALFRGNKLLYNSLKRSVCYESGEFDTMRNIDISEIK